MKNALFLVAGLMMFGYACSKDDDNDPQPEPEPVPTAAELVVSNTWKIDSMGYDTNNDGVIDQQITPPLAPCQLDNTLSFEADSTGVFSEGATKCVSSEPDNTPITWYLKDEDKTMNIDGLNTALDGDVKVIAITDSTLILSAPITVPVAGALIVHLGD